jgi:hypothetical protein
MGEGPDIWKEWGKGVCQHVVTVFMMDKSAFTIKDHVISMWVHREE